MINPIKITFEKCKNSGRACFVGFVTAGFPTIDESPDILLTMQEGGVDIIELGVPFSDPLADGKTIQYATQIAINNGTTMETCFDILQMARSRGLTVPIVMMGYLNPFMQYTAKSWVKRCLETGVHGVILVDYPPEEATEWIDICHKNSICYIPLISPTSTNERIQTLCHAASSDGFIYVVSSLGVTGQRDSINADLSALINRIKQFTSIPLAVGFGITTAEHFTNVAKITEGVVIGSRFIEVVKNAPVDTRLSSLKQYTQNVCRNNKRNALVAQIPEKYHNIEMKALLPDSSHFGDFGGQYAPETLMYALNTLSDAFKHCISDESFEKEILSYYSFIGRPSSLHIAKNLTEYCGGGRIWLKREDLNHTGSHKINNALGQVLLAKRLGKTRIIAETGIFTYSGDNTTGFLIQGAGQHGVATATVCAHFKIPCVIYMGKTDTQRQELNVFRMKLLGAKVVPVERQDGSNEGTLKDAINEAMRDWVTNVESTHYLVGSAIGPHPFPTIVKEFQSVIGREVKADFNRLLEKNPDTLIACVGGGSNAIGLFGPFLNEVRQNGLPVKLIGIEAGGKGLIGKEHSAPLSAGKVGVLHGCKTYLMQTEDGQIEETHSISAGLDYPGVGPEHAHLKDSSRATYTAVTDIQALDGLQAMSKLEGIIPALETSHAIYYAMEYAKTCEKDHDIVICVSGRGDKDVSLIMKELQQ